MRTVHYAVVDDNSPRAAGDNSDGARAVVFRGLLGFFFRICRAVVGIALQHWSWDIECCRGTTTGTRTAAGKHMHTHSLTHTHTTAYTHTATGLGVIIRIKAAPSLSHQFVARTVIKLNLRACQPGTDRRRTILHDTIHTVTNRHTTTP